MAFDSDCVTGFITATEAVEGVAMSAEVINVVNSVVVTKEVAFGEPFHNTTEEG